MQCKFWRITLRNQLLKNHHPSRRRGCFCLSLPLITVHFNKLVDTSCKSSSGESRLRHVRTSSLHGGATLERHLKLKMNQMQSSGTTSKVKLIIITRETNKYRSTRRLRSNGRSLPKLERSVASNLPDVEHEYVSSINLCWSKVSYKHHHETESHLGRKLIMTQLVTLKVLRWGCVILIEKYYKQNSQLTMHSVPRRMSCQIPKCFLRLRPSFLNPTHVKSRSTMWIQSRLTPSIMMWPEDKQ